MENSYKIKYDLLTILYTKNSSLSHNRISLTRYDDYTIDLQNQSYLSLEW